MPLTDTQLKNLKPKAAPYRVADGGGLFIEVRKRGSKLWRFAYRFDDKQKMLALGSYPESCWTGSPVTGKRWPMPARKKSSGALKP